MPELFSQSTLEMSTSPLTQAASGLLWGEVLVNRFAVLAALVLLLVELMDLILLFPHLLRCVPIWKANVELEHSVSLSRTRNTVSLVCGIMFCVVADRYSLLDPSWRASAAPEYRLAITAALVFGAILLRRLLYLVSPLRSRTSEFACTVRHALYNYSILFCVLAIVSAVIMEATGVGEAAGRVVLLVEAVMVYLIDIVRTVQILGSRYGVFRTILYLCALELLPAGILIMTCTR